MDEENENLIDRERSPIDSDANTSSAVLDVSQRKSRERGGRTTYARALQHFTDDWLEGQRSLQREFLTEQQRSQDRWIQFEREESEKDRTLLRQLLLAGNSVHNQATHQQNEEDDQQPVYSDVYESDYGSNDDNKIVEFVGYDYEEDLDNGM